MKKWIGLFVMLLTSAIVFTSCQKDFSAEGGIAKGSLIKDASGDCVPATPNGTFKQDTILKATNYVDITVNITQVGVYTITTDTVNGYSFRAVGVTATLGANTIRLVGSGKPLVVGTDLFVVKFDGSTCEFNITVLNATGGGGGTAAVFTLGNNAGGCTSTVSGTYAKDLPTSANNTVTIAITVQTAGSYTLSTPLINGVIYSKSGNLDVTMTSITLVANGGTPAAAGVFAHALTAGASTCSFDITYTAPLAAGAYTFNCGSVDVQGDYEVGTAMDATNKVRIPVTVTTPGTYNITIAAVNGVSFAGSGVVNAGSLFVDLYAEVGDLPTAAGPFNHVVIGGGGPNCSVEIFYIPDLSTGSGYIRANIGTATAPVDSFKINIVASSDPNSIVLSGDSSTISNETFGFILASGLTPITTNINYTVNQLSTGVIINGGYTNSANEDFTAATLFDPSAPAQVTPFTIRFTTITNTTPKRLKGTFSGRMKNAAGTLNVDFFNGEFDVTF